LFTDPVLAPVARRRASCRLIIDLLGGIYLNAKMTLP
jgi:hypothetical protein